MRESSPIPARSLLPPREKLATVFPVRDRKRSRKYLGCAGLLLALPVSVTMESSSREKARVPLLEVHPQILSPGDLATARVLVRNHGDDALQIESLRIFLLGPEETEPPEPGPLENAELLSLGLPIWEALPRETIAPRAHRLLRFLFRIPEAPPRAGRHFALAVMRLRSAHRSYQLRSTAQEVTIARLRMRNLKVFPTVLPDCQGMASVRFELEILNETFDPVDDAQLAYELRDRDTLWVSGRMPLGRISPGERRMIRLPEPLQVPTSALVVGHVLELQLQLHPEGLTERRLLRIGAGADVKVEDIVLTPDPALPAETVALGFTLVNRGNVLGTSPALQVRVRAQAAGKPLPVTPEAIRLENVTLAPCGGGVQIGGEESAWPSFTLSIPADQEEGDASVWITVDRVSEETETDTDVEPTRAEFHIDLPNVRLRDPFVPQEVLLGQSVSVRFRVANVRDHPQDRAPVPAGVSVRAELWQAGRQLTYNEFRTRRSLAAGQSEIPPVDFALRVPPEAQAGQALIRLIADPPTPELLRGAVRESDETDNVLEISIRLTTPLPDLTASGLRVLAPGDPPVVTLGAPTPVFFLLSNQGSGAAGPATHEIALAVTIQVGPFPFQIRAPVKTIESSRLEPGRVVPFLTTVHIPTSIRLPGLLLPIPVPPGPALLTLTIDSENVLQETNEENNVVSTPVLLVAPPLGGA